MTAFIKRPQRPESGPQPLNSVQTLSQYQNFPVKQVNFVGNLILQNLWKVQIREIKLLQNCKFYIDSNGKFSIFAKLSAHKKGNNFPFSK